MMTIAILGAGRVGSAVARTALRAGYSVNIAASGPAEDIEMLVDIIVPGATAMTARDAVADADIVVLAVPLHKHRSVEPALLAGKIVIDSMNYWAPIDGTLDEFESAGAGADGPFGSSEIVARHFRGARLVKALNHIGYHELESDWKPAGAPTERRALAVASDDADAASLVLNMIDRFGFAPIAAGELRDGASLQPGTPIFGGPMTAPEMRAALEGSRAAPAAEPAAELAAELAAA